MTEAQVQAEILVAITAYPRAFFHRSNTGVARDASGRVIRFGLRGAPDIQGCYCGRAVGIEVKSSDGRQSPDQKRWQACFERAGGIYILARTVTDVTSVLDRLA